MPCRCRSDEPKIHMKPLITLLLGLWPLFGAQATPNVLYIFTDDQSHRTVSCYPDSYDWAKTPAIDRLAKNGVRFSHAYIGSFCVPSRVSVLTGNLQHAVSNNVMVNRPKNLQGDKLHAAQTKANFWPRRLRGMGYHTGMIGKWHLYAQAPAYGLDWDWCLWWDRNLPKNGGAYYENTKVRLNDGPPIELGGYSTDRYTDYAVEYIRSRSKEEKPWFLWLCYSAVHGPNTPAERHVERYADVTDIKPPPTIFAPREGKPHFSRYNDMWPRQTDGKPKGFTDKVLEYHQAVAAIDEGVERIMAALKKTGQLDNTVVIFTSDQGLAWGQQGYRGKKTTPYDGSIRGPLIVRYPQMFPRDTVAKVPANGVDVVRTIHDITGLEPLPEMDGESLLPVLTAPQDDHTDRRPMLLCNTKPSFGNNIVHRIKAERQEEIEEAKDTSLGRHIRAPMWMMMIDGKWKYARYLVDDYLEDLYDMKNDTDEVHNLATDPKFAGKLKELRERCEAEFRRTRSGWDADAGPHFVDLFPKPKTSDVR
jgi:arylsulfatase A-like enzyme